MAGDSMEVGRVVAGGGVGVSSGEGYGATIIDFGDEPLGEKPAGVGEARCNEVWKGSSYG